MRIAMSVANNGIMFISPNIQLSVNTQVYACWLKHRQMKYNDTEQFGVLIGSRADDESKIWIDTCTSPQNTDTSQRARFIMKDPNHQKMINNAFESSGGELGYIGTWHTHPQDNPIASTIDLADWKQCSLRNPDRQLVFVIIGNKQINIYVKRNHKLEIITRKINE